jgi:hypothetical protein
VGFYCFQSGAVHAQHRSDPGPRVMFHPSQATRDHVLYIMGGCFVRMELLFEKREE